MKTWWKQLRFIVGLCALLGAGAAKAAEVAPERAVAQPQTAEAGPTADSQAERKGDPRLRRTTSSRPLRRPTPRPSPPSGPNGANTKATTVRSSAAAPPSKPPLRRTSRSGPTEKMEIKVENIRFPSRDTAVEEGLTSTTAGGALPESATYRVLHVREDGKWRIALCREWAAGRQPHGRPGLAVGNVAQPGQGP